MKTDFKEWGLGEEITSVLRLGRRQTAGQAVSGLPFMGKSACLTSKS